MSKAIGYFANGIGNFVMMMPALQALAEHTKGPVDLFIPSIWQDGRKPAVLQICDKWPVIGKVHGSMNTVNEQKYDMWFYSKHNSGAEEAVLFSEKINYAPVAVTSWRHSMVHERDHYMEIVHAMGYRGGVPSVKFPIADSPELNGIGPRIGFCNGYFAVRMWEKKKWQGFKDLAETVKNYFNAKIIGVGLDGELDGVSLDENYCGKLSILETAAVISQLDFLITTDTGNMHIADILGIPVVALFGSTLVSKNGPLCKRSRVVRAKLNCVPCQYQEAFYSCNDNICMQGITIADVMKAAREVMHGFNR